jgi:hypothetical protein
MPIEIDEMVIRTRVDPRGEHEAESPRAGRDDSLDRDELVRQCVEEVMRILSDKLER